MRITFVGAVETVTGSCHLIESNGKRILLDCGMFQGKRKIEKWNRTPFPFDPASIDCILLSHAHLDHCGRLPVLVKNGFKGPILTTAATRELARVILLDSAHIQERQEEWARRKGRYRGDPERFGALYDRRDVDETLGLFRNAVKYDEKIELAPGLETVFRDAGHIVGSAFIDLEEKKNGTTKRLTFSGDLGNIDKPVVCDPHDRVQHSDVVLLESTYGDRRHRPFAETRKELREIIIKVFKRRGVVVIPSFAMERAQELLVVLYEMYTEGLLGDAPIYLDSPMAIEVTKTFKRHPETYDEGLMALLRKGGNPFAFPNLHFTPSVSESKRINTQSGPAIIISASGMCTAGRILHHLAYRLPSPKNAVVFIGYQAFGTMGRTMVEGERQVKIHGKMVDAKAEFHTLNGFSGHAGQRGLLNWLGTTDLPDMVYLVHGEKEPIKTLGKEIDSRYGVKSIDPDYEQQVEV